MVDLSPDPNLARARRTLLEYAAPDAHQEEMRTRILGFIDEHPDDAHLRSCLEGHLTSSALLLDSSRERVLLTLHRKLGMWLQLGGHCDGDANLVGVGLREAQEESGIMEIVIDPKPIDLDIHRIPEHKGVPAHWHLDTRFVAQAPLDAIEHMSEESLDLRWFGLETALGMDLDESLLRAIGRLE
jgi:hypothetical protein